jgi:hypothetical protein
MLYRIDWCHPVAGDEADQDWRPCAPGFGVDYTDRAAVEHEMSLLRLDTADGGYDYRIVECEAEEAAEPLRTVVSRFDAGVGQWFEVTVEVKAS